LCVLVHYLAYYMVFEYQYGTLLPVLPAHVWLWRRESARGLRRLLMASFAVSLLIFLPTLNFLAPTDPNRYWLINSLLRVAPVAAAFLCLAFYGAALTWRAVHRSAFRETADHIWPILRLGGAAGAILGAVLLVVFETSPTRIWKKPTSWTRLDWIVHLEDIVGRDGVPPNLRADLHRELARCYGPINPDAALQHYAAAFAIRRNINLVVEMGDFLAFYRRYGEAQKCFSEIARVDPNNRAVQARLTQVNQLIAKQKTP
jgi:tetratricopeptide (TPR) repeat protein